MVFCLLPRRQACLTGISLSPKWRRLRAGVDIPADAEHRDAFVLVSLTHLLPDFRWVRRNT